MLSSANQHLLCLHLCSNCLHITRATWASAQVALKENDLQRLLQVSIKIALTCFLTVVSPEDEQCLQCTLLQTDFLSAALCGMGAELGSTFSFCPEDLLLTWEHHGAHVVSLWANLGQPLPCGSISFPPSLQPPCHRGPP